MPECGLPTIADLALSNSRTLDSRRNHVARQDSPLSRHRSAAERVRRGRGGGCGRGSVAAAWRRDGRTTCATWCTGRCSRAARRSSRTRPCSSAGRDVAAGEELLAKVRECFFGPMRVSVMLDSNGANTTAAAAVLCARKARAAGGSDGDRAGGDGIGRAARGAVVGSRRRERARGVAAVGAGAAGVR